MIRYAQANGHAAIWHRIDLLVHEHRAMIRSFRDLVVYRDYIRTHHKLTQDIPYEVETVITEVKPGHPLEDLMGDFTYNGIPYIGFLAGKAGHVPLYAVAYLDNHDHIRLFAPPVGNALNPMVEDIYGTDPYADDRTSQFLFGKPYGELDRSDPATLGRFYAPERIKRTLRGRMKVAGDV